MAMARAALSPPVALATGRCSQRLTFGRSVCATRTRRLLRAPQGGIGFYVEPDIDEDEVWNPGKTLGDDELDTFPWGEADGAHSWHGPEDDRSFWEIVAEQIEEAGGPTRGLQKWISWLFLPVLFTAMAFDVPPVYLFIYTALFLFAFIGIEMDKPDQPHHFPPELYLKMVDERDKAKAKQLELGPGKEPSETLVQIVNDGSQA